MRVSVHRRYNELIDVGAQVQNGVVYASQLRIWLRLSPKTRASLVRDQAPGRSVKRRVTQVSRFLIAFELDSRDGTVSYAVSCVP